MTSTAGGVSQLKYIAYAPWRRSAINYIKDREPFYKDGKTNMLPQMSTSPQNTKNFIFIDFLHWGDNGTEHGKKWEAMKASIGKGKYIVKKRNKPQEDTEVAKKPKKTLVDLIKKKKKVEKIEQEEFEPGYLKFKDVTAPEIIIAENLTVKD